jgi:cyclic pyranopterin monophosphate synthase
VSSRRLTHVSPKGEARMVDVGSKKKTDRVAIALAIVTMKAATARALRRGETSKGDVLATARIAGISAAKRTPEWIPLCHVILLDSVAIDITVEKARVRIKATARCHGKTGVEMEALVGATAAALTIYDMLKAVDRGMTISAELLEKRGGRSGTWKQRR